MRCLLPSCEALSILASCRAISRSLFLAHYPVFPKIMSARGVVEGWFNIARFNSFLSHTNQLLEVADMLSYLVFQDDITGRSIR